MKKIWIMILATILSSMIKAQVNLVPNYSFEQHDTCPNELGHLNYALSWFTPTNGTPDYFNACFDSSMQWFNVMDVPYNYLGYQNARTDSAYAGIIVFEYGPNYREYLETKLDSPLIAGTVYYVRFFVSRSDSCLWATDDLGAFFSVDSALGTTWYPLPDTPQVSNQNGNIISDRTNWTLISGSFVAQGGERFITIGNFNDDANTDTMTVMGGSPLLSGNLMSYYYIDDVCVSSDSTTCFNFSNDIKLNEKNEGKIYPNPTNDKVFINLNVSQNAFVSVFNCMGEEILSQKLVLEKTEIDLSGFDDGIYFIRLQMKDRMVTKKIILIKQIKN